MGAIPEREPENKQSTSKSLNFNCVFPDCNYKRNDIEEEEFLKHLEEEHNDVIKEMSEKENIPIKMAEMMTISNSKVFINS